MGVSPSGWGIAGWVYGVGIGGWVYGGEYGGAGPTAVLTARSTARRSPARRRCSGTHRLPNSRRSWRTCGDKARWGRVPSPSPPSQPRCQHSLVFGVWEGTGAGLAVLGGTGGGIPVETGGALVTELPCRVVQASLGGGDTKYLGVHSWDETPAPQKQPHLIYLRSRYRSRGGSSPNARCTRRARSAPNTAPPRCGCNRGHNPAGEDGGEGKKKGVSVL